MNDLERIAREAGIVIDPRWGTYPTGNAQLERLSALIRADERERCARRFDGSDTFIYRSEVAAAIRAGNE